jgi:transposase
MGGHRPYLVARERDWVLARIVEKPDLTLRALLKELAERGLVVSYFALWNFLQHEGVTFKKRMARPVRKGLLTRLAADQSASTYPASRSCLRP